MQTYEQYKDSGIDWIGQIPEHWEVKKITHLFSKIGSGTTPTAGLAQYYENGSINFLQTGDLNDNLITNTSKKITENALKDCSSLKIYPKGSLVIAMYGATIGKLGILNIETTANQACCVLGDNKSNVEIKYIFYWFSFAKKQIISMSYGGGQPNISQDLIKSLRLNFPPIHEQKAIANFLDDKTAKIDALVQTKEQQIEKLKELRQVVIHEAVTKGIQPNVELKHSGIDWIGEIPSHWEVKRLKNHTLKIGSGVTPSGGATVYLDEGIPLLRSQNILNNKIDLESVAYISNKTHKEMSNSIVKKFDVLLNITGGSIGRCNIVEFDFELNVNQHVCIIRPLNIDPHYLKSLLQSEVGQSQIWYYQQGGGREGLNFQNLKNFSLPIPPISEQEAIVSYLDEQTGKIDQAIAIKTEQIEKLKAYKQSLINEVVTGKVKVC